MTEFLLSLREADLFLLCSFASLASFCLWARILAYSAAACNEKMEFDYVLSIVT